MTVPIERGKAWAAKVLDFYPFADDRGGPGDRTLRDVIVRARKPCECNMCGRDTVPGTNTRRIVDVFDGEFGNYVWCQDCCDAMASASNDDQSAIEARMRIMEEGAL